MSFLSGIRILANRPLRAFLLMITYAAAFPVTITSARQLSAETDHYISSIPLSYPKLFRQTHANEAFLLFGDKASAGYIDIDPRDGIDDRRNRVFMELAERFAPYLVLNSTSIPMDFKRFSEQNVTFPLRIDTWDLAGHGELVGTDRIDLKKIGVEPCTGTTEIDASVSGETLSDDCKLLQLLNEFDPENPKTELTTKLAHNKDRREIKVMYIDYPGYDEESWLKEYEDGVTENLKERYRSYPRIYAHPFISTVTSINGQMSYEFVMQFWLYYPYNDGGNNHEGDWEHINVVIAPKNEVEKLQSAETVEEIINGDYSDRSAPSKELVIKRVEYYFHHYVIRLDYSKPNVYVQKNVWDAQIDRLPREQVGVEGTWKIIRNRAYWDDGETVVNTHPVIFVGADNKGWDQFLAAPGGRNRDSHGSYPAPGLYRSIGPAGASEEIKASFNHREYFRMHGSTGVIPDEISYGSIYPFSDANKIEMIPDWEQIRELNMTDSSIRQNWYWMTLPLYFGYPRAESPFSTIVDHVDMGNLAVHGPAYNSGWNATAKESGYSLYLPHSFPSLFPLGFQDNIKNNLGWLNAPAMLLQLPPFDAILGFFTAPFRLALGTQHPVYYATEHVPDNFVTLSGGVSLQHIPDEFSLLNINSDQIVETIGSLVAHLILSEADTNTQIISTTDGKFSTGVGGLFQISFSVGKSLVTENVVRHVRSEMRNTFSFSGGVPDMSLLGELNLWEYTGSLRY
ncbi:MAG: hypothetical protein E2O84_08405, partial [Bacteroidetes bacterium]